MKVIFLDIDGVLNCWPADVSKEEKDRMLHNELVARFKSILKETGAKVVLSSSWRHHSRLKDEIHEVGIQYIGCTPTLPRPAGTGMEYCERGKEIQSWLDSHKKLNIDKYCVIDDDSDMLPHQKHFKTDTFGGGLTQAIADEIIKYMK